MGGTKNCIFGGTCQECGRCESLGIDTRKEQITLLPEGFLRSIPTGHQDGYGVAFDIGTTTVVGLIWDLQDHKLLGISSRSNPQSAYGQDVISRIAFCMEDAGGLNVLNRLMIDCLNEMIHCLTKDLPGKKLEAVVAVGNTTMCHFLLSKDPSTLARSPFQPAYSGSVNVNAKDAGIKASSDARLWVLPGIAGYVGADITAGIMATDLLKTKGTTLYIDIGTNGEIVVASDGMITACSTAAGPAFEGACICCGMRATTGAVEKVEITDSDVLCRVISDAQPCGICGSGLIDAVAQMLNRGIINYTGRMLKPEEASEQLPSFLAKRIRISENGPEFSLTEHVFISQQDVREVQLAKGAILAGATLLLAEVGKRPDELDAILIAGAFGNYIDKVSALKIGLFPPVEHEKITSVGNAAGVGACMALLSKDSAILAESIPPSVRHINLSTHPDFEHCYARSMHFPK